MSAILRALGRNYPLSLILNREDAENDAHLRARLEAIRAELAHELPALRTNFDVRYNRLFNKLSLNVPLHIIEHEYRSTSGIVAHVNDLEPVQSSLVERSAILRRFCSVVEEHAAQLDWIDLVPWALYEPREAVKSVCHQALGESRTEFDQAWAAYSAARDELLEPFYAGAYPVQRPELLYEFQHLELPAQALIARAVMGETMYESMLYPYFPDHLPESLNRAHVVWPVLAATMHARGWFTPTSCPLWSAKVYAPFMARGPRAHTLGRYQAFSV